MLTVIFAEKETIRLFEETKMFFGPLYDPQRVAFCEWNKDASNFDAMVPGLYDLIKFQNEWRALVIYNDGLEKLDPFDYTEYSEPFYSKAVRSWEYLSNRREHRFAAYSTALSNPLVKITTALCGTSSFNSEMLDDEYSLLISGRMKTYEYMLKKQLEALNCAETAARLDKYQREDLKRFVPAGSIEALLSFIKTADVSGIIELIPDTEILSFIRYIGNDPMYFDPEYTECLLENVKKHKLLKSIAESFSMKDRLPTEVICLSPRTFDFEKVEHDIKWKRKDEAASSRFTDYNLYNEKLKFILCDVLPKDNMQYKFDHIRFLCLMLIVAGNDIPHGLMNSGCVYKAQIELDTTAISEMCESYLSKLRSTQVHLKELSLQVDHDNGTSVDDRTVQRLFESDIMIPVKINSDIEECELYAEYKGIGLSTDCPGDEAKYWSTQYRDIMKKFVRYLREPRRAVEEAVTDTFRSNNYIDDDRTSLLSKVQVDNIRFRKDEIEQKLVETKIKYLFNTRKYTEQIQEAEKEIKRTIARRMTKKRTCIVGTVAILAYLVGFLPLIIGNLNTIKSYLFSLSLTGIILGTFALIGFIYLFILRKRLIDRFKHFNYVMSGICGEIDRALTQFSKYVSYACNLMRSFSVLEKRDSVATRTKKILSYHDIKISEKIKYVNESFSRYVDFNSIQIKECSPYDYDFTVLKNYEYDMPSIHSPRRIMYLQQGNEIAIPVDYVESVKLIREELYD